MQHAIIRSDKTKMLDDLKRKFQAQQTILAEAQAKYYKTRQAHSDCEQLIEKLEKKRSELLEHKTEALEKLCESRATKEKFDFAIETLKQIETTKDKTQ